jgi:tripartite-type tricarboxylate transporter receptor subunit TctC
MSPREDLMSGFLSRTVAAALLLVVCCVAPALAQENFYKGKVVTVTIYTPPGSAYDLAGRLLTRHLPKHLPDTPTAIAKNMPGAGGLTATRYLYYTAPKDGTVLGTIGRGIPFEPLLGGAETVDFDPLKFTWLGSPARESSLALSWYTAKVKTAQDLLTTELIIAGTGASADSEVVPRTVNGIIGTKFKIISGYDGLTKAALSMETGEIEGIGYWSWGAIKSGKMDWVRDKKINLLYQTASTPHPDIPDVPPVVTLAKTEAQRQALELLFARDAIAFPFLAPPDLPPVRAKLLRQAFVDSFNDPELIADAQKASFDLSLVNGEQVEAIIKKAFATPPDVVAMTRKAMGR